MEDFKEGSRRWQEGVGEPMCRLSFVALRINVVPMDGALLLDQPLKKFCGIWQGFLEK